MYKCTDLKNLKMLKQVRVREVLQRIDFFFIKSKKNEGKEKKDFVSAVFCCLIKRIGKNWWNTDEEC